MRGGLYVCVLVPGVGGEVLVNDETDRYWSEALFALICFSNMQWIVKVTWYNNISRYQGSTALISRLNIYIDIYEIHIASICLFPFFRTWPPASGSRSRRCFVCSRLCFAYPMPSSSFFQRNTQNIIQTIKQTINNF